MKTIALITVFLFAFFVGAQEAPGASGTSTDASGVVYLKREAPAPYAGLLVPESRFVELLEAENNARELTITLAAHERTAVALESVYLKRLEQASLPPPWYESATFNRWVGFVLGLGATGLAVWGATEITKQK